MADGAWAPRAGPGDASGRRPLPPRRGARGGCDRACTTARSRPATASSTSTARCSAGTTAWRPRDRTRSKRSARDVPGEGHHHGRARPGRRPGGRGGRGRGTPGRGEGGEGEAGRAGGHGDLRPPLMPALLSPRNAVLVHARSEERYDFALPRRTLGRPAGRDGQGGSGGGGRGARSPSSRGRERDRRPDPRFRGGRRRSGAGRIRRSMDGEGREGRAGCQDAGRASPRRSAGASARGSAGVVSGGRGAGFGSGGPRRTPEGR